MNDFLMLSLSGILAALPSSPDAYKPVAQIETEVYSPIAGLWQLELEQRATKKGIINQGGESTNPDVLTKTCTENYNFGADDRLLVVSDTEWTYGKYKLIYSDKNKLPILLLHTTFDNNNPDCSGNQVDQSGEQFMAFFKQNSPHSFELCESDKGENCFMRFNQILP